MEKNGLANAQPQPGMMWLVFALTTKRLPTFAKAAELRPGQRGRVEERHPPILLGSLPEPGQGRGAPLPPELRPGDVARRGAAYGQLAGVLPVRCPTVETMSAPS